MIRLTDVRKVYRTRFGHNVVLDGIGLEMHMGERLGVLGRNGAGKSTMMRLISGAERPTSGRIERTMSVSWPLAFGGAFQTMLTGVDNIRFISRIYDQDFARNLAFVEEFSELGAYLREPVRTYSSGMRARLAFAISMIIEFDCFLIDEIGAVGDARFHDRCNHELFGKRGDRAMVIISHDAAYVRDHCNRFAVLHQGHLAHYEDFDEAYEDFREHIGLGNRKASLSLPGSHGIAPGRSALIEVSQHRALQDERFRALVMEGDWRRDARAWDEAAGRYAAALALYPFQRSYWVQHGHVSKEQGLFERAEISYRTACALGEPVQDVEEHLAFVMAQQGLDIDAAPPGRYRKGEVAGQAPGQADIDLLARAVWRCEPEIGISDGDRARLLRTHATCDALLAAMIRDSRAVAANRGTQDGGTQGGSTQGGAGAGAGASGGGGGGEDWIRALCAVAFAPADLPRMVAAAQAITGMEDAWRHLLAAGGFADWPLTQAALQQAQTPEFKS